MLAELRGKLDPEGQGGVERSEDLLTEAVFGAIRYLPRRKVLGPLLERLGIEATEDDILGAEVWMWPTFPRHGWPGQAIEPDVVIRVGKRPVVFEAKLYSGFGNYTTTPTGDGLPIHQLAVQHQVVAAWARGERMKPPVVVAVTRGPSQPTEDIVQARNDLVEAEVPLEEAIFRWISWRDIAAVLEAVKGLERHEANQRDDALALMDRRGVKRMFSGLRPEDYYLLTAAQRVAAESLYPDIRTFFEDLTAVLQDNGIMKSQPGWDAMWLGLGASVTKPVDWTRSYIGRLYWPVDGPSREKPGTNLALYALFDFVEPAFEVGLTIPGISVASAQSSWPPHLESLSSAISCLEGSYEVVVDTGDLARPKDGRPALETDPPWLQLVLGVLGSASHFRIRRRTDPLTLTVDEAHQLFTDVRTAVLTNPAVLQLLAAAGYVSQAGADSSA